MTFRQDGERRLLGLPLSDEALKALDDQGIALDAPLAKSDVDLVVRHREDARQFYLPVKSELHEVAAGDGVFRQRISARAELDPETAASGAPLDKGIWDLHLRIKSCGWSKETRLGAVRGADVEAGRLAALTGESKRLVLPYWTDGPGNLSLDVDQHTNKLEGEAVAVMPPMRRHGRGSRRTAAPAAARRRDRRGRGPAALRAQERRQVPGRRRPRRPYRHRHAAAGAAHRHALGGPRRRAVRRPR